MRVSNNLLAFFSTILVLTSLFNAYVLVNRLEAKVSGGAVSVDGIVAICINHPPVLSQSCSNDSGVGFLYECDVDASDIDNAQQALQNLSFTDDSPLFTINPSTGIISFTPTSLQKGNYSIILSVDDGSGCTNSQDSEIIPLEVRDFFC